MKSILVIAPHPDDETLGCAGTLLKHLNAGDEINFIFVTKISKNTKGYISRKKEIKVIKKKYNLKNLIIGKFLCAKLHKYDPTEIINFFSKAVKKIKPNILYLPFRGDAHSDHRVVFDCASPLFKTFRYPYIKSIRIYETLSETNFKSNFVIESFEPNLYVNVSRYLEQKIEIMKVYKSEIKKHPFPRSEKAIRSLAILRGSYAGHLYSEAFKLIKQIND